MTYPKLMTIETLLDALVAAGAKTVVLTGVSYAPDKTGVAVREDGVTRYYEHKKYAKGCHGTEHIRRYSRRSGKGLYCSEKRLTGDRA